MCLKAQSPPSPPEQTIRKSSLKPLNPNAEPFYLPNVKVSHHQPGLPSVYGHLEIPQSMFLPPLHTYHPCSFGFRSLPLRCMQVTHRVTECWAEEHMGERMIANTERPPRPRYMSRKRQQPYMAARREYESRGRVGKLVLRDEKTSDGHPIIPFPTTMEDCRNSRTTTVMIKNIPYHFQRKYLLSILDKHCFQQNESAQWSSPRSMYDFVYLPMDYKKYAHENKQSNLGYAFVNFTSANAAFQFFQQFNGYKWPDIGNWKACEVTKAQIQGKEGLMKKFEEKVFRCVHPTFRPVEYRPARDGANHHRIKEISVGKYEKGMPTAPPKSMRPYSGGNGIRTG